jgi:hypothetical protein
MMVEGTGVDRHTPERLLVRSVPGAILAWELSEVSGNNPRSVTQRHLSSQRHPPQVPTPSDI